ncbi:hypothetical protein TIFTF001_000999 [Ficus carica]|uniref:Uncharacterized protein n=1 Tax=Ficus carica TaxID=3494 RepID=A0AA87ZDP0_FICCA|nr:hypothetical protein TIFTF001_000999 [Ficus carica]
MLVVGFWVGDLRGEGGLSSSASAGGEGQIWFARGVVFVGINKGGGFGGGGAFVSVGGGGGGVIRPGVGWVNVGEEGRSSPASRGRLGSSSASGRGGTHRRHQGCGR